ncbi:hypothetical protein [Streptomyces sp. NBC_00572]|uniref:hypothetical protein n=1 Tax=Streptomyces sp. NBC_00572 TaxID=2903664 RepID=UPI002B1DFF2D|nr:hypothetical protein [Streptomyces sp. NBC_00572]
MLERLGRELKEARTYADIVSVRNLYDLSDRSAEDVLDDAESIAFIPWFPLATGERARPGSPLDAVSRPHRATPAQLALVWLARRSPVMLSQQNGG